MIQPKKTILKECWVWNKQVTDFFNDNIYGYSLNVCSGKNPLCSVNLDMDPKNKKTMYGDFRKLPFPHETFDIVISDPPWKISYYERFKPFFECVRVCKIGGKILYNATWIPESTDVTLEKIYVRQDNAFSNTSIITVFKKIKNNINYESIMDPK